MADVRERTAAWRKAYNEERPHSALGDGPRGSPWAGPIAAVWVLLYDRARTMVAAAQMRLSNETKDNDGSGPAR